MDEILYRSDPDWQRVVDALKAAHLAGFHEGIVAASEVVEEIDAPFDDLAKMIRALEPKP